MAGRRRRGSLHTAPALAPGELHVWRVRIPRGARSIADALAGLTPPERRWAGQLGVAEARARFAVARAALRALLGAYLGRAPSRIALVTGPHGKPALRPRRDDVPLHFSVSHSGSLALLAFSADGPVGVDVERQRPFPNALRLAERFFAPGERRAVRAARGAARSRAFLGLWTAKEAVLKARGDGLAGLAQVEIVRRGRGVLVGLEAGEARWALVRLAPGRGYVAAVAASEPPRTLRLRPWPPAPPPPPALDANARIH